MGGEGRCPHVSRISTRQNPRGLGLEEPVCTSACPTLQEGAVMSCMHCFKIRVSAIIHHDSVRDRLLLILWSGTRGRLTVGVEIGERWLDSCQLSSWI
jgi:hypothetical protein